MNIIYASHLGMCFGVRDAIQLALDAHAKTPVTILGELVHNRTVVEELARKGIAIEKSPANVRTDTAIITAHGASNKALDRARNHGLTLLEGTCPLVHFAHRSIHRLAAEGYYPVVIGKKGHVEVVGITEDFSECTVVSELIDIANIPPKTKIGVISQTTQPLPYVRSLVEAIRRQFSTSDVKFIDTVCQPTKLRQKAAEDLAACADVVLVIGGRNSNNTHQLVQTCKLQCPRVHHVETAADLDPRWFGSQETVGITAGTSTPDEVIAGVERWLRSLEKAA
ncbi:MAG: (E)-4-hydroxy-3-methyl-but-2-enyl pyrophosphate reductase [Verrucomicrobiales bacterium]|nr:(E)-4-hydroxy-3-methyl-but-2-enyl pyrophosphate reductase [Verrucomicrobiales bacterium]